MLLQNLFGCSIFLDFSSAMHSSAPPRRVESLVLERDSWAKESLQAGRKKVLIPSSYLLSQSTHTHPQGSWCFIPPE